MNEKEVYFKAFGIEFTANVTYEQDGAKYSIEEVTDVWIEGSDKANHRVECDLEEFFNSFEGELYDALEQAIADDKAWHDDMVYEQAREEGRLN